MELLDAASCVDETLLTCEGGMRIGSNVANHNLVFITVDCFCLTATHSGLGQELVTCRNVDERYRVECRMEISFHGDMSSNKFSEVLNPFLTLACFEARIRLADYVDATLTTNNLAVGVTVFERFD